MVRETGLLSELRKRGPGRFPEVINNPVGIVLGTSIMAKQNCRKWTLIVAMFKISESEFESHHAL